MSHHVPLSTSTIPRFEDFKQQNVHYDAIAPRECPVTHDLMPSLCHNTNNKVSDHTLEIPLSA